VPVETGGHAFATDIPAAPGGIGCFWGRLGTATQRCSTLQTAPIFCPPRTFSELGDPRLRFLLDASGKVQKICAHHFSIRPPAGNVQPRG
jgi:hypothetical protein